MDVDLIKETQEYKNVEKYLENNDTKDFLLRITIDYYYLFFNKKNLINNLYFFLNKLDETNTDYFFSYNNIYNFFNYIYVIDNDYNELNLAFNLIYVFNKYIYKELNTFILKKILYHGGHKCSIKLLELIIYLYENNINYKFDEVRTDVFNPTLYYSYNIYNIYTDLYELINNIEVGFKKQLNAYEGHLYLSNIEYYRKQFILIKNTISEGESRGMSLFRILWMYAVIRSPIS